MQMQFLIVVAVPEEDDFAVFAHLKDRVFTDFDEIRHEIEAETDRLGGKKVRYDDDLRVDLHAHLSI